MMPKKIKYKNGVLPDSNRPPEIKPMQKQVVGITPNICEEKNVCLGCNRGDHYGIPVVFVLHYADKSINTVCYRCGAKAAQKAGLKLPMTEEKIYDRVIAKDRRR